MAICFVKTQVQIFLSCEMQFFQIWFSICILQYPKLENYRIPDLVRVQSNLGFTNPQSWM